MKEIFNEIKLYFKTYWKMWIPIYGFIYTYNHYKRIAFNTSMIMMYLNTLYHAIAISIVLFKILF